MARGHFALLQPHSSSLLLCTLLLCCGLHHCCYICLTDVEERQGLCAYVYNIGKLVKLEDCEEMFRRGFEPLENTTIPFLQLSKIEEYLKTFQEEVKLIDLLLDLDSWQDLFEKKMAEYVKGVQAISSHHRPAACKPPCGLQKQARRYNCMECIEEDCNLPVACELEDIHVKENGRTEMSCSVTFTLPESYTVIWKFAKNLRVTDLSYFKLQHRLQNDLDYTIRPTLYRHRGTYFCEIQDDEDDVLVEKFFFVNVSRKDQSQGLYLRRLFKQIIARMETNRSVWAPRKKQEEDEDNVGFDIIGFIASQKPLGTTALIFATVTAFSFFFLVTLLIIMAVHNIIDED